MSVDVPRYLIPFHPKKHPNYFIDVLIVGGGLAGLRAAIDIDPHLKTLVVTKDALMHSSSSWAQGGIAGVVADDDRFENHIADTISAGWDLCDRQIVETVIKEAPGCIRELMAWGADFDRQDDELSLGREGGHSHDRIVHASDATGREIMRAVVDWTEQLPHVEIWENTFTLDAITDGGTCRGAVVSRPETGPCLIWAKQTILCTGGVGQIYRETSNPEVATGDGVALAYRAGAEVRDMEFMQFHPTMLYIAGSNRTLITEAVRGAGAHLIDCNGYRFMADYDERLELAPRDIVSHGSVQQMEKTRHANVFLDVRHLDAAETRKRFPGITATCASFGIDISTDLIPVRPGAHYFIGGVTVDVQARTTIPGLWAAGEATSSGLHGANRLASNSLLEAMVFGAQAGRGASAAARETPDDFHAAAIGGDDEAGGPQGQDELDLEDIRNSLKTLMWHQVGLRRDEAGLSEAANSIEQWCRYVLPRPFAQTGGWELQNMLCVARLMIDAAVQRRETRGVHQRTDHPELDPGWQRHIPHRRHAEKGNQ